MRHSLLTLSADFGSGHLYAASAVASAWELESARGAAVVAQLDNSLLEIVAKGYLRLLRTAPSAYRRLYQMQPGRALRSIIRSVLEEDVLALVEMNKPTAIVATHPFPGIACAHLRETGQVCAPLAVVLTDFSPHPLWVHGGVDRYLVASQVAAERLAALGAPADRIRVTGIPVRSGFATHADAHPRLPQVLVMGGGLGLGPIMSAVTALVAASPGGWTITVVCGINDELRCQLRHAFPAIRVIGQTDEVDQLMAEADLLVTKPGGLTCSEALASGLPMLLLEPLPGHEEENATYLEGAGVATRVRAEHAGIVAAKLLFERRELLNQMRLTANQAGRPLAAAAVVDEVLAMQASQQNFNHLFSAMRTTPTEATIVDQVAR